MTATDHARTFPCGSNIDTRPDERLWHRHRRSEGSSLQIAVGDEPVKRIRHALSPAVPAEAATVTIA
jgi:hypothetical protein